MVVVTHSELFLHWPLEEKQGSVSVCIMSLNGPQSPPTDKKCQQLNPVAFKNSIVDETGNLGVC